ncbi:MAG: RNA polymerase sigma factor [Azonexus sp.]
MFFSIALNPPDELDLEQLYREHFDPLRNYLARRLDCPEAGRDAAQEIFLRLLLKPPVNVIHNPRAFLLHCGRNLLIDLARLAKTRPLLLPIEDFQDSLSDPIADPARIAAARQQLAALAEGIETLPPKCREVFFLHRFEALTQNEIAAQMGISAKTVEKHLANAMLQLRRLWACQSTVI